jgi:hypothetical protein
MNREICSHPTAITHHGAHALAAKLRRAGIYTSGKDVLTWPLNTTRKALFWVDKIQGRHKKSQTFADYMGADLPPASQHSWLPFSAGANELDRAGS